MKLRIRGDSLRLRLTKGEVDSLHAEGVVAASMGFAPGQALEYVLRVDGDAKTVRAEWSAGRIEVLLPKDVAHDWTTTDRVGIEDEQSIEGDRTLRILIEKDFQCLTPRAGEDDTDAFPNPNTTC